MFHHCAISWNILDVAESMTQSEMSYLGTKLGKFKEKLFVFSGGFPPRSVPEIWGFREEKNVMKKIAFKVVQVHSLRRRRQGQIQSDQEEQRAKASEQENRFVTRFRMGKWTKNVCVILSGHIRSLLINSVELLLCVVLSRYFK